MVMVLMFMIIFISGLNLILLVFLFLYSDGRTFNQVRRVQMALISLIFLYTAAATVSQLIRVPVAFQMHIFAQYKNTWFRHWMETLVLSLQIWLIIYKYMLCSCYVSVKYILSYSYFTEAILCVDNTHQSLGFTNNLLHDC